MGESGYEAQMPYYGSLILTGFKHNAGESR